MEKLTEDDITSIIYFWKHRGDIERWVGWKKKKPLFKKEFPELVKAWDDYKTSIRTLTAVVDSLIKD